MTRDARPDVDLLIARSGGREALMRTEWVLANGLGGFAMGTAAGVPLRRYHGWLVPASRPPVGRVMALTGAVETLVLLPGAAGGDEQRIDLSCFRFGGATGGVMHPRGLDHFQRFERDPSAGLCRWWYAFGPVRIVRELTLVHGVNAAIVRYRVRTGGHAARLELRPLVALRDFHGPLLTEPAHAGRFTHKPRKGGVHVAAEDHHLTLNGAGAAWTFDEDPQWWRNFEYLREAERGLEAHEDLYSPGLLAATLPSFPAVSGDDLEHVVDLAAAYWRALGEGSGAARPLLGAPGEAFEAAKKRSRVLVNAAESVRPTIPEADRAAARRLVLAADQFVVQREMPGPGGTVSLSESVIAGYPWFGDWGRDTCIAIPGLLLATGRLAEAGRVLETFARLVRRGLVPNCFDDATGEPMYNTADGSLWYLHAACAYARAGGTFGPAVTAACLDIADSYREGTDFGIRVDDDGLVVAASAGHALTWMDAKRDGVVFTPRMGKPIELQALWYSGLLELADVLEEKDRGRARELRQSAERCGASIRAKFWDPARGGGGGGGGSGGGHLADVVGVDGVVDWSLRPNQIFAVSQPFSALSPEQRRAVVDSVRNRLLTPMGLRTLDPLDSRYHSRYRGTLFERDRAYHNGTAWPWLIGAYVRAVLKVGQDAGDVGSAAAEARAALAPLLDAPRVGAAPGTIPEVFDGDAPPGGVQRGDGCMAQAWSVAEVLGALRALWAAEGR
jgi:glycogen debranching enzyme